MNFLTELIDQFTAWFESLRESPQVDEQVVARNCVTVRRWYRRKRIPKQIDLHLDRNDGTRKWNGN